MDEILDAIMEDFPAFNMQDSEYARVLAELRKGES